MKVIKIIVSFLLLAQIILIICGTYVLAQSDYSDAIKQVWGMIIITNFIFGLINCKTLSN